MNGPQHYAEAERLLGLAAEAPQRVITGVDPEALVGPDGQPTSEWLSEQFSGSPDMLLFDRGVTYYDSVVAQAQVHATLALAAAAQSAQDDIARCPHGSTGICMACLTPFIDHYGRQLVEGVRR